MASDPARIGIAGDDDSLLVQTSSGLVANELTKFACSPLQILKSRTPRIPRPPKTEMRCPGASRTSSFSPYSNKENLNTRNIKSGMSNLSVEPHQMKKRRKGGGYNLRKSLAWDRAFLSEEGVLDPYELSMISGIASNKEELSTVCDDDEKKSLLTNSNGINGLMDLTLFEEILFKELPCSNKNDDERVKGCMLQRKESLPANLISASRESHTQSLLHAHTVKECAPKGGGCSSSLTSASHKRLLNGTTTKVAARNSKMLKKPDVKQDSSAPDMAVVMTPTRERLSDIKCSKIPKPGASNQKSVNLKGYSKPRSGPRVAITSPGCSSKLSNIYSSGTKNIQDASEVNGLVSHPVPCISKNNHSEVVMDRTHLSGKMDATKAPNATRKFGVSLHPTSCDAGSSVPSGHATKVSGLRMPSPSLKFFSETNAPASKSLLERNLQSASLLKTIGASGPKNHLKPPYASCGVGRGTDQCVTENTSAISVSTVKSSNPSNGRSCQKVSVSGNVEPSKNKVLSNVVDPEQMSNQEIQGVLKDLDQKCLDYQVISLKDERTYGNDNMFSSSHLQSTMEHSKPLAEHPRLQFHHSLAQVNCTVWHEPHPTAQPIGVQKSMKEHSGDGEIDSRIRNNGRKSDSRLEEDVSLSDQWTQTTQKFLTSKVVIHEPEVSHGIKEIFLKQHTHGRNLKENSEAVKSDKKANVIHVPSERKSREGTSRPYAIKPMVSGVVAGEKSSTGSASNVDDNGSLRNYVSGCNIARKHSQQVGNKFQDSDIGYDNSLIRGELESENDEVTDELPGPIVPVEQSNLWHASTDPLPEENEHCRNSQMVYNENVSDILQKIDTAGAENTWNPDETRYTDLLPLKYNDGDREVLFPSVIRIRESCCSDNYCSENNGQCVQEQQEEHQVQNGFHLLDGDVQFGHGIYLENGVLQNKSCPPERMHQEDARHTTFNSSKTHEAQVSHETTSSCSDAEPRNRPCMNLATTQISNGVVVHCRRVDKEPALSVAKSNEQTTSSTADYDTELSCSPNRRPLPLNVELDTTSNKLETQVLPTEVLGTGSRCVIPNGDCAREWKGLAGIEERNIQTRIKKPEAEKKQGGGIMGAPTNAVPFSDEWLAAIEAAGEEILTLKSGRVQNSPPDKPIPEPSPWSPVKRKNNQNIGPYDCTKFTNTHH